MFEIPITNLENVRVRNYLDPPKSLFTSLCVFSPSMQQISAETSI